MTWNAFPHIFKYDMGDGPEGSITDLGIPLATTEIRRYGYEFETAITGPDGEIYLRESESGGCLFVYFPPFPPRNRQVDEPF